MSTNNQDTEADGQRPARQKVGNYTRRRRAVDPHRPSKLSDELLEEIAGMHRGGMSKAAIARDLTDRGVQTSTGLTQWRHSMVTHALDQHERRQQEPGAG